MTQSESDGCHSDAQLEATSNSATIPTARRDTAPATLLPLLVQFRMSRCHLYSGQALGQRNPFPRWTNEVLRIVAYNSPFDGAEMGGLGSTNFLDTLSQGLPM